MVEFREDKIQMVIVDQFEGVKYWFFFGHHYNKGHSCWDIAILNQWTKAVMKLHFPSKEECQYKWEKLRKDYKDMELRRKESNEAEDEDNPWSSIQ